MTDWAAEARRLEQPRLVNYMGKWQLDCACCVAHSKIFVGKGPEVVPLEGSMFCALMMDVPNGCKPGDCDVKATPGRLAKWYEWTGEQLRRRDVAERQDVAIRKRRQLETYWASEHLHGYEVNEVHDAFEGLVSIGNGKWARAATLDAAAESGYDGDG